MKQENLQWEPQQGCRKPASLELGSWGNIVEHLDFTVREVGLNGTFWVQTTDGQSQGHVDLELDAPVVTGTA